MTYRIELANKIRRGRCVGNEYMVTRPGRPASLARFHTRRAAEQWIAHAKAADRAAETAELDARIEKALEESKSILSGE